jgi:hypothetical protein
MPDRKRCDRAKIDLENPAPRTAPEALHMCVRMPTGVPQPVLTEVEGREVGAPA